MLAGLSISKAFTRILSRSRWNSLPRKGLERSSFGPKPSLSGRCELQHGATYCFLGATLAERKWYRFSFGGCREPGTDDPIGLSLATRWHEFSNSTFWWFDCFLKISWAAIFSLGVLCSEDYGRIAHTHKNTHIHTWTTYMESHGFWREGICFYLSVGQNNFTGLDFLLSLYTTTPKHVLTCAACVFTTYRWIRHTCIYTFVLHATKCG